MKLLFPLFLAVAVLAHGEVKVVTGTISDRRASGGGSSFDGLEIEMKLSGPELAECKGMRIVVKEAKEDTGKAIPEQEDFFHNGGFAPLQKAFGGGKQDEFQTKVSLKNPARAAKTFSLDAAAELLVPGKDPAAVIAADVAKQAGAPLEAPALKAAGATITLNKPDGGEVGYAINDPNKKVALVEFCGADGKALETNGTMTSSSFGKTTVSVTLRGGAPAGLTAKVYMITAKSVLSVPVKLANVELP